MNILHYIYISIYALLYTYTPGICFLYCSWWCFVCWLLYNTESAASSLCYCCVHCEENFTIRN